MTGFHAPTAPDETTGPHELPTLTGRAIELRPLRADDAPALVAAAADGELWNLKVTVVPGAATVDAWIATALAGVRAGTVIPFTIRLRESGRVVGSTRFWKVDRVNRKLEIGSTWLAASAQRTMANTEAKYLMLRYAFETLDCVRVQFTTDVLNAKSRAAILRLGAKEEGVVRRERIMPDGRKRDSVRFSIIEDEWPEVKAALLQRLQAAD
jgi:N-acetyltransferase